MGNEAAGELHSGTRPVVLIDPGHGGRDPGAVYETVREAEITLAVAWRLKSLWAGYGGPGALYLTREEDRFVALKQRTEMADELSAEVLVSIHCDASERPEVSGFSVHHAPGAGPGRELAACLHRALARNLSGRRDRGLFASPFWVLKRTLAPAALVECEFLSHAAGRAWLKSSAGQELLASTLREGILEFLHAAV